MIAINHKAKRITFNVSENCFFKCKMCSFWKNKEPDEKIDLDTSEKIFNELKYIKGPDTRVSITGGEPLLIPNICDFIKLSHKHGFETNLNTNAWLINKNNITKIIDSGLTDITISLDGSTSELHDEIRGMPGSFDQIKNSIHLIKNKIRITITAVISKLNLHDILKLIKCVQAEENIAHIWIQSVSAPFNENNIINDLVSLNHKKVYWFEHPKFKHLWPDNKNLLKKVYSNLILNKKRKKFKNPKFYSPSKNAVYLF